MDDPETSLLAWTTTPYTLPSNLSLCVHPKFTYIKIHDEAMNRNIILHENLLKAVYKDPKKAKYKKIAQFQGSTMKGWRWNLVSGSKIIGAAIAPIKPLASLVPKPGERREMMMMKTTATASKVTGAMWSVGGAVALGPYA